MPTPAQLARIFLKLGLIGFGGPAAHIALMQREFVERRGWIPQERFVDMLGMVNLLPGPNSTELAISIGAELGGRPGIVIAGVAFITPAFACVLLLAWLYERYGALPDVSGILAGITPVVLALILHAVYKLGRTIRRRTLLFVLGTLAAAGSLLGLHPLPLLFGAGLAVLAISLLRMRTGRLPHNDGAGATDTTREGANRKHRLWQMGVGFLGLAGAPTAGSLFLYFLYLGSVLYGSGYVLVEFLRRDLVGPGSLGWLTDRQLLDAVAVGQITPGPLFTTATFVGYMAGGVPGSIAATLGIFLPSFIFVLLSHRWIARLRNNRNASAFLDGVNIGAIGLVVAAVISLGAASLNSVLAWAIALAALLLLAWERVNPLWLILAGGVIGWVAIIVGR